MTIDVNAVPPILREYRFPITPAVNAPIEDTMSDRSKMYRVAILFAANEKDEMITMMMRFRRCWILSPAFPHSGCRLFSEEIRENSGTMKNCAQKGAGWRYHGEFDSRKHPANRVE